MRRMIALLVACCMITALAGCSPEWKKKFTRKSKTTTKKMPRIYQVKKYDVKPSIELYKKHYVYWKTWQDELVEVIGENAKKDKRCIEEIVGQLGDMQNILVPEKGGELTPHIEKLAKVRDVVVSGELSTANRTYILRTLEREERFIKKEFVYTKIKNSLKKSFEEEAAAPPKEDVSQNGVTNGRESCVRLPD